MAKHTKDPPPVSFDPAAAAAAWEALAPRRDALRPDELLTVNVDLKAGAVFVLGLVAWLREPEPAARFARLAADDFDHAALARLEQTAWAAWHAAHEQTRASRRSQAVVPVETVTLAFKVRERMLVVINHNTDEQEEVADIRRDSGYTDLASDLSRCADLYVTHDSDVRHDRKHYDATDLPEARRLAGEILEAVARSRSQSEATWSEHGQRAYTELTRDYEEVAGGGRFLWRKERGDERFPKLVNVARAAPTRSATTSNADATSGDAPTGDATNDPKKPA